MKSFNHIQHLELEAVQCAPVIKNLELSMRIETVLALFLPRWSEFERNL